MRSCCLVILAAALTAAMAGASPARAWDSGTIGVYADAAGTRMCAGVAPGSFQMLQVLATAGADEPGDITGAEFRIEITRPQGWTVRYLPPAGAICIGNPIDALPGDRHDPSGVTLAFTACPPWDAQGHLELGTLFVRNDGGASAELLVKRRSQPSGGNSCALFTRCDEPYFSTRCNTPRIASSCDEFITAPNRSAGGECDAPYAVFALNGVPDPKWTAPPRQRDADREVLAMLTGRTYIALPEGEAGGPLARASFRSDALRHVLERYAIEWVAKGMPCFDLADTIAVTRTGEVVRLTDWSKLWVFTVPPGASVGAFLDELSQLNEVLYAEPNGYVHTNSLFSVSFQAANPVVRQATLRVTVPHPVPGRVEIYDVRGRRVRTLAERTFTAGTNAFYWDGTSDTGRRMPSGTYFVHVAAGGRESTHKLTFVR